MVEFIGYIAAFLTTASFVPQVIKTIKTQDTSGISLTMYSMFVIGVIFWTVYTSILGIKTMIIANYITLTLSGIILFIKIRNTFKR